MKRFTIIGAAVIAIGIAGCGSSHTATITQQAIQQQPTPWYAKPNANCSEFINGTWTNAAETYFEQQYGPPQQGQYIHTWKDLFGAQCSINYGAPNADNYLDDIASYSKS